MVVISVDATAHLRTASRPQPAPQIVPIFGAEAAGAEDDLKVDVSSRIRFAQAAKRISSTLEAPDALRLIDYGVCPIRTLHVRGVNAKHRPFATSLGQGPSRRIKRPPVVCHDDGSRSFDPVDYVEGHGYPLWLTALHRMRSPEAGGRCSLR